MNELRNFLRLNHGKDHVPLIEQLRRDNLPVIMWGAGNVAVHVLRDLRRNGITLSGIWVDGSSPKTLDGIPIYSYEQVAGMFSRFNVVCGHSRYDIVNQTEQSHKEINRIYCLINSWYANPDIITSDFIEEHYDEYQRSFELLEDDLSRKCFAEYLNSRYNEDYSCLLPLCISPVWGGGKGILLQEPILSGWKSGSVSRCWSN